MSSSSLATNCKPCLGYATKGAAIAAMRADGMTHAQIGRLLDMQPRAVSSLHTRTRQRAALSVRTVEISGNVFLDLEREARRRDTTPAAFAAQLLTRIIVDGLYSAVLDD